MRRCTYCGKDYIGTQTACVIDHYPVVQVLPPSEDLANRPTVDFIRLFFKSPQEEEFAVRCAQFIADVVGERVALLRPDTTWLEIFQWLGPEPRHAALFALLLKKRFGAAAKEVIAHHEFMTVRDFVEYACSQESTPA